MKLRSRLIIFAVSLLLYVVAFVFMDLTFHKGQPTVWILPVLAAGWLFGMWPAIVIGLVSLPVNALMLILFGEEWRAQILGGGAIAGAPATVIIGAVVGRLRDLGMRLRLTIAEKVRAEEGLHNEIERRKKTEKALAENEEKYRALSIIDPLTGLYNRRHFFEYTLNELERSERHGTPLAIFIYDVDYFKEFNDAHGHLAGDLALMMIATASKNVLRKIDILARFGGEEFICLLPGTDLPEAQTAAERVRREIETSPVCCQGETIGITASFGVSALAQIAGKKMTPQETLQGFIRLADDALYLAKASGRNRVCICRPT